MTSSNDDMTILQRFNNSSCDRWRNSELVGSCCCSSTGPRWRVLLVLPSKIGMEGPLRMIGIGWIIWWRMQEKLLVAISHLSPSYSIQEYRNKLRILLVTHPILPMSSSALCGLAAIIQLGVGLREWRKASSPVP